MCTYTHFIMLVNSLLATMCSVILVIMFTVACLCYSGGSCKPVDGGKGEGEGISVPSIKKVLPENNVGEKEVEETEEDKSKKKKKKKRKKESESEVQ